MRATGRWLLGSTLVGLAVISGLTVWLWPVLTMLFDAKRIGHNYYLPSESMLPTLAVGDRIRPLRPEPFRLKRGAIIVFRGPNDVRVARIVGIGGDYVAMRAGHLSLNGIPVVLRDIGQGHLLSDRQRTRMKLERLPGESSIHRVLDAGPTWQDDVALLRVPMGELYVLGDNRDRAADSRIPPAELGVGMVPVGCVIGVVDRVLWSKSFGERARPADQVAPVDR